MKKILLLTSVLLLTTLSSFAQTQGNINFNNPKERLIHMIGLGFFITLFSGGAIACKDKGMQVILFILALVPILIGISTGSLSHHLPEYIASICIALILGIGGMILFQYKSAQWLAKKKAREAAAQA